MPNRKDRRKLKLDVRTWIRSWFKQILPFTTHYRFFLLTELQWWWLDVSTESVSGSQSPFWMISVLLSSLYSHLSEGSPADCFELYTSLSKLQSDSLVFLSMMLRMYIEHILIILWIVIVCFFPFVAVDLLLLLFLLVALLCFSFCISLAL